MPFHEPHPILVSEVIDIGELQLRVGPIRAELNLVAQAQDVVIESAVAHELKLPGSEGKFSRLDKRDARMVADVNESQSGSTCPLYSKRQSCVWERREVRTSE